MTETWDAGIVVARQPCTWNCNCFVCPQAIAKGELVSRIRMVSGWTVIKPLAHPSCAEKLEKVVRA